MENDEKAVVKTAIWAYIEGYNDATQLLVQTADKLNEEQLQEMFDNMEKSIKEKEGKTEQ